MTELYLIWLGLRVSVVVVLLALVAMFIVNARDARRWRRFVRLYRHHQNPARRAIEMLELRERLPDEISDSQIRIGLRGAARRRWLEDIH